MITPEKAKLLEAEAQYRSIQDLKVFVVGGGFQYIKMFADAGFRGATNVEDADIVCFTGGEDVSPDLYQEKAIPGTHYNPARDAYESMVYGEALGLKKPLIGICRGAQFLNVMAGGRLWQDVNNHAVGQKHSVLDVRSGATMDNMTSTHHQQMIAGAGAELIAVARLSTKKKSDGREINRDVPEDDDVEVLWYPDELALCFQPHPEFGHGECRDYFLDLVDDLILPAC